MVGSIFSKIVELNLYAGLGRSVEDDLAQMPQSHAACLLERVDPSHHPSQTNKNKERKKKRKKEKQQTNQQNQQTKKPTNKETNKQRNKEKKHKKQTRKYTQTLTQATNSQVKPCRVAPSPTTRVPGPPQLELGVEASSRKSGGVGDLGHWDLRSKALGGLLFFQIN